MSLLHFDVRNIDFTISATDMESFFVEFRLFIRRASWNACTALYNHTWTLLDTAVLLPCVASGAVWGPLHLLAGSRKRHIGYFVS